MALETLKSRVLSGLFWKFSERLGVQGIQFLVQIFLARLLFPKDYALVALIAVMVSVSDVLIWSGFSTALVQQKDVDDKDYSSVFFLGLGGSLGLYLLLFTAAPLVSEFFAEPLLVAIMRVQALVLILGALRSIQNAILIRTMQFKKIFHVSVSGIVASGIVGLGMAWLGYGVWSLVFSQLANGLVATLVLWVTVGWIPTRDFSLARLGSLFSFGWKLLVAALLETVYANLRTLFIGKIFDKEILGNYNRADTMASLVVTSLDGTISSVLFPALSSCQDDPGRLKALLRRSVVTGCFLLFPAMIGLASVSRPLVLLLLTEKWLGCVFFLQMCCLAYAFYPLHTANLQAINALGRSDVFLKLEILKKIVGVGILLLSIPFGVNYVVGSQVVVSLLCTVINAWPNKRLLDYSVLEQWSDVVPSLLLALVMGGITWSLTLLAWSPWLTLILQIMVGTVVYFFGAWLFRFECFYYLLRTVREQLGR